MEQIMEEIRFENEAAREEAAEEVLKCIAVLARRIQETDSDTQNARSIERNEITARAIGSLSEAYMWLAYNIITPGFGAV